MMSKRVMKFILNGRRFYRPYDESHMVHFSNSIKAFLDAHPDEVVYVSINKTTVEKMRRDVICDPILEKIAYAFQVNTFSKDYKCIAYVGPNEEAIDKVIDDTLKCTSLVGYTIHLEKLNGFVHKPVMKGERP